MPIKILMIIPSLDYCNGITSYAMNYYRQIDRKQFQIDFAVHYNVDTDYKREVESNGDHVYFMGDYSVKSLLRLKKRINKLYLSNNYDIIHCHVLNVAYFYFKEAEKNGIRTRILHSHATKNSDNNLKNARNFFLKVLALKYTTDKFACSKLAGDFLFKKNYTVINNAINCDKFRYSIENNNQLRKEFKIPECAMVFGFVGRLSKQKNIKFLLRLIKGALLINENFIFFIIGNGIYRPAVKELIAQDGGKRIIYIENTNEIAKYYSLFDVLLLPSYFEGLPVTGVEAQIAGCKLLCSNTITTELNFSGNCKFLELNNYEQWIKEIKLCCKNDRNVMCDDYDIKNNSKKLEDVYRYLFGVKNA